LGHTYFDGFFNPISQRASTVIFVESSPLATAVAPSRCCSPVGQVAGHRVHEFGEVGPLPPTPRPPPDRPAFLPGPTSRAHAGHFARKRVSTCHNDLRVFFNSKFHRARHGDRAAQVSVATSGRNFRDVLTCAVGCRHEFLIPSLSPQPATPFTPPTRRVCLRFRLRAPRASLATANDSTGPP